MLNKIYNKFIPFLVLIQPIFDVITSFMIRNNYTITIGIILKMVFILLAVIYLLFIDCKKKKNLVYLAVIFLVVVLNIINSFAIIKGIPIQYFNYAFKYVYYTVMLLYFIRWLKYNEIDLSKFNIPIALIALSYILSIITGTSILSYDQDRLGISGWYYSANEFGTLLSILYPLSMYNALYRKESKVLNWILFLMCIAMLLGLGTKTGLLGFYIPIIIYVVYRLIFAKREKLDYKFTAILAIFVISLVLFRFIPSVQNTRNKIAYEKNKIINKQNNGGSELKPNESNNNGGSKSNQNASNNNGNSNNNKKILTDVILSGRDTFYKNVKAENSKSTGSRTLDVLFGQIHIKNSNILIVERDFIDIYNLFGLIALLIVLIPLVYILFKFLVLNLPGLNLIKDQKLLFLVSSVLLAIGIAYICGHTFLAPSSTTFLCIIIALLVKEMNKFQDGNGLKRVMFICSVGGHLTQMLELKDIFNNYNYILVTEKTDVTKSMAKKYNIAFLPYGSRNQKFVYPFILLCNCIKSVVYIIKYDPNVIVSTGANTAAAMCCLGKILHKKVIYIESFAKRESPTVTGKCIYRLHAYTTFVVQWESMLKFYPNAEYWGGIY